MGSTLKSNKFKIDCLSGRNTCIKTKCFSAKTFDSDNKYFHTDNEIEEFDVQNLLFRSISCGIISLRTIK